MVAERDFEEADSGDNPAPPNRVAAGPSVLKVVRVRECGNVIRNPRNVGKIKVVNRL